MQVMCLHWLLVAAKHLSAHMQVACCCCCIPLQLVLMDAKDYPSPAKNCFKFDDDDNFEQYKQGFIAKNTADNRKCSV